VNIFKEDSEKPKKKQKGYDHILETVVFFVEKDDYPDFKKPMLEMMADQKQIKSAEITTKGPFGQLLKDLKEWGGIEEDDAIHDVDPEKIKDLATMMEQIQEGIIKKQKEEEKFKEDMKAAQQGSNNEEAIQKLQKAEDDRVKKRKDTIA